MMDEDLLGAHHPAAGGPHPTRKVVVLEHADAEPFVEEADAVQERAPHHRAVERQHGNVPDPALVAPRVVGGEAVHFVDRLVEDLDTRLVAAPVGDRSDQLGDAAWWAYTLLAYAFVCVAYGVVWVRYTVLFDRPRTWWSLPFGLLWGLTPTIGIQVFGVFLTWFVARRICRYDFSMLIAMVPAGLSRQNRRVMLMSTAT